MQRIELIACVVFFCVHALRISVFDCVTSRASVAWRVLRTTWKPFVGLKTDLKVGFQAAVRNTTDAMHAGQWSCDADQKNCNARTQKMQRTQG